MIDTPSTVLSAAERAFTAWAATSRANGHPIMWTWGEMPEEQKQRWARIAEAALRSPPSEPVAGITITLIETSPHLPAAGTMAIRKWDNHGLPVGTHRLYTHPAADLDKPSAETVSFAVRRAVANVLIVHDDGTAVVDEADLDAAIRSGIAVAFAGLIPPLNAEAE